MNKNLSTADNELLAKAYGEDSDIGHCMKTLCTYDVLGFEKASMLYRIKKFLTLNQIEFEFSEPKLLLWLPRLKPEPLKALLLRVRQNK